MVTVAVVKKINTYGIVFVVEAFTFTANVVLCRSANEARVARAQDKRHCAISGRRGAFSEVQAWLATKNKDRVLACCPTTRR